MFKRMGFRFELHGFAVYVRVPGVGAAFVGGGLTAFDSWKRLRSTGAVR